ncbi:undecaprenyl-diphosphate phosphatase [Candidatus Dependentiae bacterium]|nr:undecaprenyl-diphosphate phosphatase [Candidatus Dependentiae bacterium]
MSLIFFYLILILQIILESLPVSSSGHLKIVESIWNLWHPDSIIKLNKSLEYVLHGPTLLILTIFLYNKILYKINFDQLYYLILSVIIADSVTVLIYFFINYFDFSFFKLFYGFLITFLCLISLKFAPQGTREHLNFKDALILGLIQGIALLPGISRLASTIAIACWLGIDIKTGFLFSLSMQLPLVIAGFSKGIIEFFILQMHSLAYFNFNIFFLIMSVSTFISYYCLDYVYFLSLNGYFYKFAYYIVLPIMISLFLGV